MAIAYVLVPLMLLYTAERAAMAWSVAITVVIAAAATERWLVDRRPIGIIHHDATVAGIDGRRRCTRS
jgi:hypothetical protein